MAYTTDEKSTGLDVLTTLATGDLHIVGDVSDSGRAKAITENNLEITIANSSNFVDTLVANNYFTTELANDTNFVNELTTNTTFQSAVNNFVTVVGGGGSGASSGKPISFSSTWTGSGHQQGYIDSESVVYSNNGSQISFQSPINGIQYRNTTSDWASSAGVQGYVLMGDYLYLLLAKGGSPLEQRLYRYDASDLSLGGTLMTISGQAFGIAGSFQMTSDGVYFYFSSDAGTTANDYEIAKYSLSGTTLTYVSTTTCGSTPTQFASFAVDSSGQYIGYDTQVLYVFDNTGTLTDTIPLTGGSASTSFLNWTNTIYFKNANQDFVKLDLLGTDVSSSGSIGNDTQIFLGGGYTDSTQYNNVMTFGDYIISAYRDASNGFVTVTQKKDVNGGYNLVSNLATWSNTGAFSSCVTKSSDGTKLYEMSISGNNFFPWTFTLKEYDLSGTLVNTSTFVTAAGFMFRTDCIGAVVVGNKVIVSAEFNVSVPASGFWTEFTISGASLTTSTATNLAINTSSTVSYFGGYDGTNIYIALGISGNPLSNGVTEYSYSSPNFTTISTFNQPSVVSTTPSPQEQFFNGFELTGAGTIGIYQNISSFDINSAGNFVNTILKAKYNIFTF